MRGRVPFLFVESHWDTGEPFGTAKPLRPLEICPLTLPPQSAYHDDAQNASMCAWLDALETRHPPCAGYDSVGEHRQGAADYLAKQRMRAELWQQQG